MLEVYVKGWENNDDGDGFRVFAIILNTLSFYTCIEHIHVLILNIYKLNVYMWNQHKLSVYILNAHVYIEYIGIQNDYTQTNSLNNIHYL